MSGPAAIGFLIATLVTLAVRVGTKRGDSYRGFLGVMVLIFGLLSLVAGMLWTIEFQ